MTEQTQTEAVLEAHYTTPPESVMLYGIEFKRAGKLVEVPDREDETKLEFVFQQYQWRDLELYFSYSKTDVAPIWFASMNGSQSAHQGDIASTPKEAIDKLFQKVTAAYNKCEAAGRIVEENRLHLGCDLANLQTFLQHGHQHPTPQVMTE